jgi:hypothetical protein
MILTDVVPLILAAMTLRKISPKRGIPEGDAVQRQA